jgi:hypothetical protein
VEIKVYNPHKGRYETIDVEFTADNTTWFNNCTGAGEIYMITDFEGDLLVREFGYTYPVRIYDTSRADIGYKQTKALELKLLCE